MADMWLRVGHLAMVIGVTREGIRKQLETCVTRQIKGGRGGKGGIHCQVLLSSLPQRWQVIYRHWFANLSCPWQDIILNINELRPWEAIYSSLCEREE